MRYKEKRQAATIKALWAVVVILALVLAYRTGFDRGYDCAVNEMTHYEHTERETDELLEM